MALLPAITACRVEIALGEQVRRCCGSGAQALVAVSPNDQSLPAAVREAARSLRPGGAIAAEALPELVGGRIVVPGLDIPITASADLGDPAALLTNFAVATALLHATGGDRLLATTTVVLPGPFTAEVPPGWQLVADAVPEVPLRPGVEHEHGTACAA